MKELEQEDVAASHSRAGRLQKLGGKDKDRWQEVDVKADASGLCWTSGNVLRDAASGSQRRLRVQELVSAEYWSDIGIEFGFEVATTAKQGKVYKFSASAAAERDRERVPGAVVRVTPGPAGGVALSKSICDHRNS